MNINSHILRLSGRAELPRAIDEGHNYRVTCEGSITSSSLHDNEDGSWNKVYTFKPVLVEVLEPRGESLRLRDPRRNSQKLRNYLFKCYFDEGYSEDFDQVYDAVTMEAMAMMPELLRRAIKRVNDQ